MMVTREGKFTTGGIDGLATIMYLLLVAIGWFSIFSAVYDKSGNVFAGSLNSTRQLVFLSVSVVLIIIIFINDFRNFDTFAFLIFSGAIVLLILVLLVGTVVNGSRSWLGVGSMRLQPSEFAKFATALAIAKYLSNPTIKPNQFESLLSVLGIIFLPMILILLQGDAGSAMVFGSFIFVLYRERFVPHWLLFGGIITILLSVSALAVDSDMFVYYFVIPILSITLIGIVYLKTKTKTVTLILSIALLMIVYVYSVRYIFDKVLKGYQKERIMVLLDDEVDKEARGSRYNLQQSKIAIGSGGLWGKGFLEGKHTKYDYVPEHSTDFIFCTLGEEQGWFGSMGLMILYLGFVYRLIILAERQKDKFARIYGYSVASIIFFHFAVNIAMTIGLFPVVGIPLPFMSYGGSSLLAFTILVFIFLKLDAHREQQVIRS